MRERTLGSTGLVVSQLALGGAGFLMNQHRDVDDAEVATILVAALASGVSFIDTAPAYGNGVSESRIGLHVGDDSDVVVATKTGLGFHPADGFVVDMSYEHTLESVEASSQRLGREVLDLVQVHEISNANFTEAMDGAVTALLDLRERGSIRFLGVTGSEPESLQRAVETGWFDTVMVWKIWNLLDQSGGDVIKSAHDRGMGVIVAAPFASGILATGARDDAQLHYTAAAATELELVRELERCSPVPLHERALRFCLDERISCVVAAVDNAEQLRQNVAAANY